MEEIGRATEEVDKCKGKCEAFETKIEALREELGKVKEEKRALETTLGEKDSKIKQLSVAVDQAANNFWDIKQDLAFAQDENWPASLPKTHANPPIRARVPSSLATMTIENHEDGIQKLVNGHRNLVNEVGNLSMVLRSFKQHADAKDLAASSLDKENEDLQTTAKNLTKRNENNEREIARIRIEYNDMVDNLKADTILQVTAAEEQQSREASQVRMPWWLVFENSSRFK